MRAELHKLWITANDSSIVTHVANTALLVHEYCVVVSTFIDTSQSEVYITPVSRHQGTTCPQDGDARVSRYGKYLTICRTSSLGQPPWGDPLNWLWGGSLVITSNGMTANLNKQSSSGHQISWRADTVYKIHFVQTTYKKRRRAVQSFRKSVFQTLLGSSKQRTPKINYVWFVFSWL
jgi:hypothetical protein